MYDLSRKRVWVTGHRGMVGSAIVRALTRRGDVDILTADRTQLDLREQTDVSRWVAETRPHAVFHAAAKTGSIFMIDSHAADYLYENVMTETNVIHAAHLAGVEKLLFVGSSAVYPRQASSPIREEELLTGPMDPVDQWYVLGKILGIKLCQAYRRQYGRDFIAALPANLYGPNDNFDLDSGHVLPALLRRFHEAAERGEQTVTVWGTGTPRREFVHVDDLAAALILLIERYSEPMPVNVGAGVDIEIRQLAAIIQGVTGFKGRVVYDSSKPDGVARKLMDDSRLRALGWEPRIGIPEGIASLYRWLLDNRATLRGRAPAA